MRTIQFRVRSTARSNQVASGLGGLRTKCAQIIGVSVSETTVETLTPGWDETSESHMAHLEHQQKLRDGVEKLTEALDQVRSKLATHREDAREIEVENVAIVN